MILEVYSDADEIELRLNGRTVARNPVGSHRAFVADFELPYEKGELTAIALMGGTEVSRTELRSASEDIMLDVRLDKSVIELRDGALVFAEIELRDRDGNLVNDADRPVTVAVSGPGSLAALGSGRPATTERFDEETHGTYDGRVLAIIRPDAPGHVEITVSAAGLPAVIVSVEVQTPAETSVQAPPVRRTLQQLPDSPNGPLGDFAEAFEMTTAVRGMDAP
ncbi:DUF4982 domain-containing protein [Arthrobacter sp. OY3WO11]|uniref:DUF4982 domain-containing protein n=1 Tax=Arthrobacter sp. OY3WO11 TaxID=1835723 RepID=UPI00082C0366|nr:DUF4982 domain-containing protein [Arthrobacter sp. OY3WO11]